MTTEKAKELLALDSQYILAIAVGVWLPCLFIYGLDLARPFYIAQTLLFGTGYLLLVRMTTALVLLSKATKGE